MWVSLQICQLISDITDLSQDIAYLTKRATGALTRKLSGAKLTG
jgi:hypothetical protein